MDVKHVYISVLSDGNKVCGIWQAFVKYIAACKSINRVTQIFTVTDMN
jgi:hypothetical protein